MSSKHVMFMFASKNIKTSYVILTYLAYGRILVPFGIGYLIETASPNDKTCHGGVGFNFTYTHNKIWWFSQDWNQLQANQMLRNCLYYISAFYDLHL